MNQYNPYAAPAQDFSSPGLSGNLDSGAYRDGDAVVVPRVGAELPDRCVVCNAPANGFRMKKTFYWHTPGLYALIFLSWLIYIIVALIVRKSATVGFGLCEQHRVRRRNGLILALGGLFGFLALMLVGAAEELPALAIVSGILMIAAPITGALMARSAHPKKIDDQRAWLKVGLPFLDSLAFSSEGFPPGYGQGMPGGWTPQQASWGGPAGAPQPAAQGAWAPQQPGWGPPQGGAPRDGSAQPGYPPAGPPPGGWGPSQGS